LLKITIEIFSSPAYSFFYLFCALQTRKDRIISGVVKEK